VEDLIKRVRAFRQERDWGQYHSPKNLVIALMVEAGELAEHFQWLTEEQSSNLPPEKLAEVQEEIGDVMIYLANLCDRLGIDPMDAAYEKLEKNKEKYPAARVQGKYLKYTEYK
jgi:NTP pyrophosphatase (non-canonical NTP hydrolase)